MVDDREINRTVLRRQLAEWGIHHECAASAAEALAKLRTSAAFGEPFDIALFDSSLPDRDAMTLAQEVRRDGTINTTGLIFLASASQRTETSIFLSRGFAATLVKPLVRQGALLEALRKGWDQRKKYQLEPPAAATPGSLPPSEQSARSNFGLPSHSTSLSSPVTERAQSPQPAWRVLLAEDNSPSLKLAKRLLEKIGCRVTEARNGQDAVKRALEQPFDLVFMDCEMADGDGFQATVEIRRLESQGALPQGPVGAYPHHRPHRERRLREPVAMSGGGDGRLPHQTGQRRGAAEGDPPLDRTDRAKGLLNRS